MSHQAEKFVQHGPFVKMEAFGTATLKFWVTENPNTLVDRYAVVFDAPTNHERSDDLMAVCMNRLGHLFHDEVEQGWLGEVIKNSVQPRQGNGYFIIDFDALPEACKKAVRQEIEVILYGDEKTSRAPLRYRVTYNDHFFYCFAESQTHAAEIAMDRKDIAENNIILAVDLADFAEF
ncbi:hypothetical protein [Acidithiobacillus albertensis]|uniref:hypothetical protein n=1 Tax=Acidithiobacillus albertensis TaxID=119978 RepID=UPI00094AF5E0|nr:hypothetical protein [Acidithiobacillus albertensis]